MNNRSLIAGATSVALAATLGLGLVGCGGTSTKTTEATTTAATSQAPQYTAIGTKASGAFDMLVTNGLGTDVTAISIKPSTDEEFPVSMMAAGATFASGSTDEVFYSPISTDTTLTYDIALTEADGTVVTACNVPLASVKEMTIKFEDDVCFVDYKDAAGSALSTKEAAVAKKQADDEAAAAAEAEAVAAEKSSTSTSTSTSSGSGSSTYSSGYSSGSTSSSSSSDSGSSSSSSSSSDSGGSSSASQSSDVCAGGGDLATK